MLAHLAVKLLRHLHLPQLTNTPPFVLDYKLCTKEKKRAHDVLRTRSRSCMLKVFRWQTRSLNVDALLRRAFEFHGHPSPATAHIGHHSQLIEFILPTFFWNYRMNSIPHYHIPITYCGGGKSYSKFYLNSTNSTHLLSSATVSVAGTH